MRLAYNYRCVIHVALNVHQRYIFGDVPVNYLVYLLLFGSNELDSDVKCQIFELVESYMYI